MDVRGCIQNQMSRLTPTSTAPLAPVPHLLSPDIWKETPEVTISKRPDSFFFLRLFSKPVKESKRCTKINCTWSPHARQFVRSSHIETLQWNQIRDREAAMPGTSSYRIYQLKRVPGGWPEQLCSSGKTAKEGHKGQDHLLGWKLKTHAKPIAVLLLFSKVRVVSTAA